MKRLAVVINHFPGEGRLSGLVSFARALIPALARSHHVTVFSGQSAAPFDTGAVKLELVGISPLFWFRVWRRIGHDFDGILVLSGIHSPRWLKLVARFLKYSKLPRERIVFVQAVTLDRQLDASQANELLGMVSAVAFLNPFEAQRAKAVLPGACYLKSGIDVAALGHRSSKPAGAPIRIGFFGHLNKVKGADRLRGIVDRIPPGNWECVIAGSGVLSDELNAWMPGGQGNISLHGYLQDPFALLRTCDLLVAPFSQSNTVLGISQVVLEALALGIPVVGTNTEAIASVVRDNYNGRLDDTEEGMARALHDFIINEVMRNEFSGHAVEIAAEYSIERTAQDLIDMLKSNNPSEKAA